MIAGVLQNGVGAINFLDIQQVQKFFRLYQLRNQHFR